MQLPEIDRSFHQVESKMREVVLLRRLHLVILTEAGHTVQEIARLTGRDRATIYHHIREHENQMECSDAYREAFMWFRHHFYDNSKIDPNENQGSETLSSGRLRPRRIPTGLRISRDYTIRF